MKQHIGKFVILALIAATAACGGNSITGSSSTSAPSSTSASSGTSSPTVDANTATGDTTSATSTSVAASTTFSVTGPLPVSSFCGDPTPSATPYRVVAGQNVTITMVVNAANEAFSVLTQAFRGLKSDCAKTTELPGNGNLSILSGFSYLKGGSGTTVGVWTVPANFCGTQQLDMIMGRDIHGFIFKADKDCPTTTTTPAPTVTVTAGTSTYDTTTKSTKSSVVWTNANATSCTNTGGWTGNWTGEMSATSVTGTVPVSLTNPTEYVRTCTGPGGTATAKVTINPIVVDAVPCKIDASIAWAPVPEPGVSNVKMVVNVTPADTRPATVSMMVDGASRGTVTGAFGSTMGFPFAPDDNGEHTITASVAYQHTNGTSCMKQVAVVVPRACNLEFSMDANGVYTTKSTNTRTCFGGGTHGIVYLQGDVVPKVKVLSVGNGYERYNAPPVCHVGKCDVALGDLDPGMTGSFQLLSPNGQPITLDASINAVSENTNYDEKTFKTVGPIRITIR